MNELTTPLNKRHYARMMEALDSMVGEKNTNSLGSFISTLGSLIEGLDGGIEWKNRFRKSWGILEEVNAFVLDEGRKTFSDDECEVVRRAAHDLKLMVEEADHQ